MAKGANILPLRKVQLRFMVISAKWVNLNNAWSKLIRRNENLIKNVYVFMLHVKLV